MFNLKNDHYPASVFTGDDDHSWKIAHVPLTMDSKFRYAFQGIRGDPANSLGGIQVDDITLGTVLYLNILSNCKTLRCV